MCLHNCSFFQHVNNIVKRFDSPLPYFALVFKNEIIYAYKLDKWCYRIKILNALTQYVKKNISEMKEKHLIGKDAYAILHKWKILKFRCLPLSLVPV